MDENTKSEELNGGGNEEMTIEQENPSSENQDTKDVEMADNSEAVDKEEKVSNQVESEEGQDVQQDKVVTDVEIALTPGRRLSSRRRTQPGRYVATIDHIEKKREKEAEAMKKRKQAAAKSRSSRKKTKDSSAQPDDSPSLPIITSEAGVWTKTNNSFILSSCRRPIPQPFNSSANCPNTIDSIQLGTGVVTAWCPAIDRTPDLYRVDYESPHNYTEDITYDELMVGIASEKKRVATSLSTNELELEKDKMKLYHGNLRQRASDKLRSRALLLLPELCAVGAWELQREEKWKKKYQRAVAKREMDEDLGATGIDVPRYYGKRHPSAYFRDDNSNSNNADNDKGTNLFSFSPSQINQRIKLGCNLAYEYCRKKRELELGLSLERTRRSTRAAAQKEDTLTKPSEYDVGGRVANFILSRLEFALDDEPEEEENNVGQYYIADGSRHKGDTFFNPPKMSILEYLGKNLVGSNSISTADIQDAVIHLIRNKSVINVMAKEKKYVEMMCTTGDTLKEMKEYDTASFGRCKFCTRDATPKDNNSESKVLDEKEEPLVTQSKLSTTAPTKPANFEKQKKFEIQRYLSIHSGYTIWPSWNGHISSVLSKLKEEEPVSAEEEDQTKGDEALAAALSENTTATRRSKRAAQSDSTNLVFYGTGASITQNQLADSIHRLIMQAYPGSLTSLELCKLVCEGVEYGDWKKVRLALGRLLCREGRIARFFANTNETDMPCFNYLSKAKGNVLLQHSPPEDVQPSEIKLDEQTSGSTASSELVTSKKVDHLQKYIRELHMIELYLRSAIMDFTQLQVDIDSIASSAEEDAALDPFEDEQQLEWADDGHELLKSIIMRPGKEKWRVIKYIPSEEADDPAPSADATKKSQCKIVKRRARFQAVPCDGGTNDPIILTEAQVRAGLEAINMWKQLESNICTKNINKHPFAGRLGSRVSLSIQNNSSGSNHSNTEECDLTIATVVGFNVNDDNETCILLLPDKKEDSTIDTNGKESFWGVVRNEGSTLCFQNALNQTLNANIIYQDFEEGSAAYSACESVLDHLKSHHKASPFLEPVDPIELGLDDYFDIIKNPMDLGAVEQNLITGKYSKKLLRSVSNGENCSPVKALLEGDFMKDVYLVFDNALEYNPKGSWINNAASQLKRAAAKKIEAAIKKFSDSEETQNNRQRSVYVDDSDSGVDEAYLESDEEDYDAYLGKKKSGKRQRKNKKDAAQSADTAGNISAATQAINSIELPQGVPSISASTEELSSNSFTSFLSINSDVGTFSLPLNWGCTYKKEDSQIHDKKMSDVDDVDEESLDDEIIRVMDSRVRRSHRGMSDVLEHDKKPNSKENPKLKQIGIQYFPADQGLLEDVVESEQKTQAQNENSKKGKIAQSASNRQEVEELCEGLHENYFAKVFNETANEWMVSETNFPKSLCGLFADNSFPPYLGRIFQGSWEIRPPFIAPALRWIIRGLIQSGHLSEMDPMTLYPTLSTGSNTLVGGIASAPVLEPAKGTVTISNSYYWNHTLRPFDIVEQKKVKVKSKNEIMEEEERKKDEERELSEYEQDRARRIARNQEKLRMLGLG